ncbi:MAG: hypothetical protein KME21_15910 [Desmonostoc vinosum HA7617-LM4]|nr:hypothetical protein [Desmonostoc vinosum HA7617-LM4]
MGNWEWGHFGKLSASLGTGNEFLLFLPLLEDGILIYVKAQKWRLADSNR